MSSCKECFHKFVCTILENKGYQQDCKHFADRSQFAKLPCKIGSTIYHIENGKIVEYIVFATHTYSRKSRNKHKLFLTLPSDGRIHLVINDFDMANGITVFLNKEEAEQAQETRVKND